LKCQTGIHQHHQRKQCLGLEAGVGEGADTCLGVVVKFDPDSDSTLVILGEGSAIYLDIFNVNSESSI
jgi:hypothetical protein